MPEKSTNVKVLFQYLKARVGGKVLIVILLVLHFNDFLKKKVASLRIFVFCGDIKLVPVDFKPVPIGFLKPSIFWGRATLGNAARH